MLESLHLPLLLTVFSASLLGSLHCAGMCGPFVAVYSAASEREEGSRGIWRAHLAYHGGRALTYLTLGGLAGVAGAALDKVGNFAGVSHVAAIVSGLLVIAWGLSALLPALPFRSPAVRFFGPRLAQLGKKPRVFRASLLGIFTPLLPCGWLYAFVVTAAGTGSPVGGIAVLFVFWLGTIPALLGLAALLGHFGASLRKRLPVLTGITLIVIGSLGVMHRMQLVHAHPADSSSGQPSEGRPSCH